MYWQPNWEALSAHLLGYPPTNVFFLQFWIYAPWAIYSKNLHDAVTIIGYLIIDKVWVGFESTFAFDRAFTELMSMSLVLIFSPAILSVSRTFPNIWNMSYPYIIYNDIKLVIITIISVFFFLQL